jgi:hypothetical protein
LENTTPTAVETHPACSCGRGRRRLLAPVALALLALLAWLWMTPYQYSAGGRIRTHRLTGRAELFEAEGGRLRWRPIH